MNVRGKTTQASTEGSFKPHAGARSRVQLDMEWGDVTVREGSRTPWGQADNVSRPAAGIAIVSTPSHGGVKLSPERNAAIPAELRNPSGWYEEDCEAHIVAWHHPDAFPRRMGGDMDAISADGERGVKQWFPDKYTAVTGTAVTAAESSVVRDRQNAADADAFRAQHANQFVTHEQGDRNQKWTPDGYEVVPARIDATGEVRHFLIPTDEVIKDHMWQTNVLVDPNRHLDVSAVVAAGASEPHPLRRPEGPLIIGADNLGINYDSMTAKQADKARRELEGKPYRFRNEDGTPGPVESLAEHFARVGVVGRREVSFGNKDNVSFIVEYPGSRMFEVPKSTFDALSGVPDTTTESDRWSNTQRRAEHRLRRAQRDYDSDAIRRAKDDIAAARTEIGRIRDSERVAHQEWEARRDERHAEAFSALTAERGLEF